MLSDALERLGVRGEVIAGHAEVAALGRFSTGAVALAVIDTAGDADALARLLEAAQGAEVHAIVIFDKPQDCRRSVTDKAADFLIRPFSAEEFEARAAKFLRTAGDSGAIVAGELAIHPDSYEASIGGRPLKLTFKEYELLKHLAENPGRVLTRQALLNQIWEYDYYGGSRTVDVHVRRLRSKLGRCADMIKTVRQVGYKFEA